MKTNRRKMGLGTTYLICLYVSLLYEWEVQDRTKNNWTTKFSPTCSYAFRCSFPNPTLYPLHVFRVVIFLSVVLTLRKTGMFRSQDPDTVFLFVSNPDMLLPIKLQESTLPLKRKETCRYDWMGCVHTGLSAQRCLFLLLSALEHVDILRPWGISLQKKSQKNGRRTISAQM